MRSIIVLLLLATPAVAGSGSLMDVSADGKQLLVANSDSGTVSIVGVMSRVAAPTISIERRDNSIFSGVFGSLTPTPLPRIKPNVSAMPKVEICLQVMERQLSHGKEYLLGSEVTLADFYMLPMIHAFGFAPESQGMYPNFPAICTWREQMEALPTVKRFRAAQPPRAPIEHARKWAVSHRPKY